MEALGSKLVTINATIRRLVLTILLLNFSASIAGGMSEENRAKFISSLADYKTAAETRNKTSEQISKEKQDWICQQQTYYIVTKECLERKYMSEGYFIVNLAFKLNHVPSETLPASFPNQSWEFEGKEEELNAFLQRWADPVLAEYLGNDYGKFYSAKLVSLNNKYASIKVLVLDASEIEEVFMAPRLIGASHVGIPDGPPEEIAN